MPYPNDHSLSHFMGEWGQFTLYNLYDHHMTNYMARCFISGWTSLFFCSHIVHNNIAVLFQSYLDTISIISIILRSVTIELVPRSKILVETSFPNMKWSSPWTNALFVWFSAQTRVQVEDCFSTFTIKSNENQEESDIV